VTRYALLSSRARADLFSQFATLERAGIPPLQALPILYKQAPIECQPRIKQLQQGVQQGAALAKAGRRSGLFLPWEARLITVAEEAGKLQATFSRLNQHYAARARRLLKFKGRLIYPLAILVLAVFVAPAPALLLGDIGPASYLLRTAAPLLGLYTLGRLLIWRYRMASLAEQPYGVAVVGLALPILGGLMRRQQRRDFLASLALLLEAGVPAIEALSLAAHSVGNPVLRERFAGFAERARAGATLAQALAGAEIGVDAVTLIDTGEKAGKLDEMLWYVVRQLDERLDAQLDMLAEWAPRVLYAVVVGFVLSSIL
jgi:general secretion pathway protein F